LFAERVGQPRDSVIAITASAIPRRYGFRHCFNRLASLARGRINRRLSLAANHSFTPASYSFQPLDRLEVPQTWLESVHTPRGWRWRSRSL
jgi:hypothetical protein